MGEAGDNPFVSDRQNVNNSNYSQNYSLYLVTNSVMRIKGSPLLPHFLSTVANAAIAFSLPISRTARGAHQAFRKFDELQKLTNRQLQDTLRHAVRGKYIVISGSGERRRLVLTHKGKRFLNQKAMERLRPPVPRMWDKKWRLVLFDIPEEFKKNRNSFAAGLKRMGFVQIQKSCFAFPFPCLDEIDVLADFHEVRSFVTFLVAESLEGSKALARRFKLP